MFVGIQLALINKHEIFLVVDVLQKFIHQINITALPEYFLQLSFNPSLKQNIIMRHKAIEQYSNTCLWQTSLKATGRAVMMSQCFLLDTKTMCAWPSQRTGWKCNLSKSRVKIIKQSIWDTKNH